MRTRAVAIAICSAAAAGAALADDAGRGGGCLADPASNLGCEFYAVTLPNPVLDQATFAFGIELLNPGTTTVDVSIEGGALPGTLQQSVPAGAVATVLLPWLSSLSLAGQAGGPPATALVAGGAYHLVASGPLSALQLNPSAPVAGPTIAGTCDGSLLLAAARAGTTHRIAAPPTWNLGGPQFAGFVAVVAVADATTVEIVATGPIVPGAGLGSAGGTVVLNAGDVLLVSSEFDAPAGGTGSNLSGTLVTGSAPVLVWSGHALTQLPVGFVYADHVEESVPPVTALGTDYLLVRPTPPDPAARVHFVEVVGIEDGTSLTTAPPVALPATIDAGQHAIAEATVDFRLHGSKPVLVAQYMVSQEYSGGGFLGDPSLLYASPAAQGLRTIDFLAPPYLGESFVVVQVVAPAGADVTLNGAAVTNWTPIAGSHHAVAEQPIFVHQRHRLVGDVPVTATVVAHTNSASYWFPAAAGLAPVLLVDGFEWGDTSGWSSAVP